MFCLTKKARNRNDNHPRSGKNHRRCLSDDCGDCAADTDNADLERDEEMSELTLYDFLPEKEAIKYKPVKSHDWKWKFCDYPQNKNGLKVFSCFACGGGSTMGYKLAGCEVVGCCEIDKRMNDIYVANHHPKYNYLMDIREFNEINDLPDELYNLDILDGSPPCTTFSIAGDREKTGERKRSSEKDKKNRH